MTWLLESAPPTRYSKVGYAPDGTLYAISSGPSTVAPEGLYRRETNGSWTSLGPDQGPLYESDLASLRFSINDPELILLGGADFGVAGNAVTIWRTIDGGGQWTKVYEGRDGDFTTDIEIVEDGTDQNMVASYDGFTDPNQGGAFNSTDGGATWNLALNGLPDFARLPRLCTSPANARHGLHVGLEERFHPQHRVSHRRCRRELDVDELERFSDLRHRLRSGGCECLVRCAIERRSCRAFG